MAFSDAYVGEVAAAGVGAIEPFFSAQALDMMYQLSHW